MARRYDSYIEGFALRWSVADFASFDPTGGISLETDRLTAARVAEQARQIFANLGEQLFALSKCPDYIVNRGHYFGTQLSDADKQALIAFLKTF